MEPSGDVQIVVQADVRKLLFSSKVVLGLDQNGTEIWRIPVKDGSSWRAASFAYGDLNGDGAEEWVVPDRKDRLAIMSQESKPARLDQLEALGFGARLRILGDIIRSHCNRAPEDSGSQSSDSTCDACSQPGPRGFSAPN
jgi:hypothetical protein